MVDDSPSEFARKNERRCPRCNSVLYFNGEYCSSCASGLVWFSIPYYREHLYPLLNSKERKNWTGDRKIPLLLGDAGIYVKYLYEILFLIYIALGGYSTYMLLSITVTNPVKGFFIALILYASAILLRYIWKFGDRDVINVIFFRPHIGSVISLIAHVGVKILLFIAFVCIACSTVMLQLFILYTIVVSR